MTDTRPDHLTGIPEHRGFLAVRGALARMTDDEISRANIDAECPVLGPHLLRTMAATGATRGEVAEGLLMLVAAITRGGWSH